MKRRTFTQSMLALSAAPLLAYSTRATATTEPSSPPLMGGAIADVPAIKVGHHTLTCRSTGCTVILCEDGAVGGVDVRGSAPGTRETDLLNPTNAVQQVQAILLSGGSAYGLEAATGVMCYLEERKLGFKLRAGVAPIVPAAILMDLGVGDSNIRPDAEAGFHACLAASGPIREGNLGGRGGSNGQQDVRAGLCDERCAWNGQPSGT